MSYVRGVAPCIRATLQVLHQLRSCFSHHRCYLEKSREATTATSGQCDPLSRAGERACVCNASIPVGDAIRLGARKGPPMLTGDQNQTIVLQELQSVGCGSLARNKWQGQLTTGGHLHRRPLMKLTWSCRTWSKRATSPTVLN